MLLYEHYYVELTLFLYYVALDSFQLLATIVFWRRPARAWAADASIRRIGLRHI